MDEVLKATSPLTRSLAAQGAFAADPFVYIDIGCGGGFFPVFREFGSNLIAHGIEPTVDEVERLQQSETFPNVKYHAGFVGLPPGHPFAERRAAEERRVPYDPWWRLSLVPWRRATPKWQPGQPPMASAPPAPRRMADPNQPIGITDFTRKVGLTSVDFLKIDVDGPDVEVLHSAKEMLADTRVLGVGLEITWWGGPHPEANTFHNLDRIMRQNGFALYPFSIRHYSRIALPAPFIWDFPAQTTFGQPYQGDAIYFRDLAGSKPYRDLAASYPTSKLLKLICLFDIAGVPDCAAEVVLAYRDRLAEVADPDQILDALVPPLNGEQLTYREYMRRFAEHPEEFFPVARARTAG